MNEVGHAEGVLTASSLPFEGLAVFKQHNFLFSAAQFLLGSVWKQEPLTKVGAAWG